MRKYGPERFFLSESYAPALERGRRLEGQHDSKNDVKDHVERYHALLNLLICDRVRRRKHDAHISPLLKAFPALDAEVP
jgi:hypothetical protein